MIPTISTARPHHIKSKKQTEPGSVAKNLRRAWKLSATLKAAGATGTSSQRPLLPILGVSKLETKPPAKTDLKREYLNPKASAANLRQYAANTLPKNPAVADLFQHGEDMKSSLARPLENYFCLGLNLQMTCSTSQARPEKRSNHSGA